MGSDGSPMFRKHLHGRGEDFKYSRTAFTVGETPPRTWRRLYSVTRNATRGRNTSTDVEKTPGRCRSPASFAETPPRTWRRLASDAALREDVGNTSTDVEKTADRRHDSGQRRKHLHGRGEDCTSSPFHFFHSETPPRTWRRQLSGGFDRGSFGNTSTDVEKTKKRIGTAHGNQKHLHGRGEDFIPRNVSKSIGETPPRTWRRPPLMRASLSFVGNTSTDVEKTGRSLSIVLLLRKHLHGRGEDVFNKCLISILVETPPRTWRRRKQRQSMLTGLRNTSTDVEKTANAPQ